MNSPVDFLVKQDQCIYHLQDLLKHYDKFILKNENLPDLALNMRLKNSLTEMLHFLKHYDYVRLDEHLETFKTYDNNSLKELSLDIIPDLTDLCADYYQATLTLSTALLELVTKLALNKDASDFSQQLLTISGELRNKKYTDFDTLLRVIYRVVPRYQNLDTKKVEDILRYLLAITGKEQLL